MTTNAKPVLYTIEAHPAHLALMREACSAVVAGEDVDARRAASKVYDALDDAINPGQAWPEPYYLAPEMRPAIRARVRAEMPAAIDDADLRMSVQVSAKGHEHLKRGLEALAKKVRVEMVAVFEATQDAFDRAVKTT